MKKNNKKIDSRKSFDLKSQFKKIETGIKDGIFVFIGPLTIEKFSIKLSKSPSEVIKYFFLKGFQCNVNTILTENQMGEICLEFGYDFKKEVQIDEMNFLDNVKFNANDVNLKKRPPIITIMGHVDHGKTTLLDTIRKTHVAKSEAGGITQNIGAYQIKWKNDLITFIDTPGHEAFSKMRAHGANITDIVILVVAADDGIKPQTIEAIEHAKSANVPIIVFVNKMDKPNINVERILTQLSENGLTCEEWGGKTIIAKGSALNCLGIDDLLEAIVLTSDIMELKASESCLATGITIESHLDKGLGPVANLLVRNGVLEKGDNILIGNFFGKIKKILGAKNEELLKALPSTPIKIFGISGIPSSGDKWIVTKDEKLLKELAQKRQSISHNNSYLQLINNEKSDTLQNKEVNLIIKVDCDGMIEPIKSISLSVNVDNIKVNLVRVSIGQISESDINLAKASKSHLFAFNLKDNVKILEYANSMNIKVKNFNIIYQLKEEIEKVAKGSLEPVYIEEEIGVFEIKQLWQHSHIGVIAGGLVISGEVNRNAIARLIRNKEIIFENKKISSLRTGKENVQSVSSKKECGITIDGFNDFVVGDILNIYKLVEQKND